MGGCQSPLPVPSDHQYASNLYRYRRRRIVMQCFSNQSVIAGAVMRCSIPCSDAVSGVEKWQKAFFDFSSSLVAFVSGNFGMFTHEGLATVSQLTVVAGHRAHNLS